VTDSTSAPSTSETASDGTEDSDPASGTSRPPKTDESVGGTTSQGTETASEDSVGTGSEEGSLRFDLLVPDAGTWVADPIARTCDDAERSRSSVGCLFYAVDMDLVVSYDAMQFAVAVANVQLETPANVVLEVNDGSGYLPLGDPVTLEPQALHVFLPPDRHQDSSGVLPRGAYRVQSDVPIVAYQFQPYEAGESFTSDASVLYPVAAWDTLHYLFNRIRLNDSQDAYVTVVAARDGTRVTIDPVLATLPGPGVPAVAAGVPLTVEIDEGDIFQVSFADVGQDPSGTRITANPDHPIAVFMGNTCTNVPEEAFSCDHLQDQLLGVRLWGQEFVASRVPVRSTETAPEPSVWQIIASEDGTEVEFFGSPAVVGLPTAPVTLDAAQSFELTVTGTFEEPGDFYVLASAPISVGNYMTGSSTVLPIQSLGDPSFVQLSPVEQFLERYVLLVPPEHWRNNAITVTRAAGAEISMDGAPIPEETFIAVTPEYEVGRLEIAVGVHTFESDAGFSVVVAGFDDDDSYAYLGGAGTASINPVPEG